MTSPPMTLTAKYDEMAGQVHVTLGHNSYKMSEGLRFMGCTL